MKKLFYALMIFLLVFTIKVKADYSASGIVTDYTTVYKCTTFS